MEGPFLGRVLLWVPALLLAGQDPTRSVGFDVPHFLQFLSLSILHSSMIRHVSARDHVRASAEVHIREGVVRENCFKGPGSHLPLGSPLCPHKQSSYRPHTACVLGHPPSHPPSFMPML